MINLLVHIAHSYCDINVRVYLCLLTLMCGTSW